MKKFYQFCLILCCLMLSFFDSSAAESDPLVDNSRNQRIGDCWGYDVVLAASFRYGWQEKNSEKFEGRMFPFYFGSISFDDSGEQKMMYFTSSNQSNTLGIEVMFEDINLHRGRSYVQWFLPIDHPSFCSSMLATLHGLGILEVIRLPLGTAIDYDFSFTKQTEFRLRKAEVLFWQGEFDKSDAEWGISKENLIMTPKQ